MPSRWFIYVLKQPDSGAVRYVGWTRDPQKRFKRHLGKARTMEVDYPVCRWLKKLLDAHLVPVMQIVEEGVGDWEAVEQRWIEKFRSEGADLLNVALGGHFALPPASRAKAGLKLRGRKLAPEHVAAVAAQLRGKKRPGSMLEVNRRNGYARRGKKMLGLTEAGREARRANGRRNIAVLHELRRQESREVAAARNAKISESMRRVWATRMATGERLYISSAGLEQLAANGKRNIRRALDAVRNMSPEEKLAYRAKLSDAVRRARASR